MDIENTWKNTDHSDDMLDGILQQKNIDDLQSKLPLKKLKGNLLQSLFWAVAITIGYIVLFFNIDVWQVHAALLAMIAFNTWIIVDSWKLYKKISVTISPNLPLKQELEKNYNSFDKWWRIQEKTSWFIYPIAVAGGFILGGTVGSGKSAEAFLSKPYVLLILGVCILVLVPLCYLMAKWMFKVAYGKHLKKIKELIDELS